MKLRFSVVLAIILGDYRGLKRDFGFKFALFMLATLVEVKKK